MTGPGGIGKTRLALAAAHRLAAAGEEVVFVDLADASGPEALPAAILAAAGAPPEGRPGPGRLAAALGDRRVLLLLDSFEPALAAAATLADLLAGCPGVRVLVTSRRALGLVGETAIPVPPLACPAVAAEGEAPALTAAGAGRCPAVALFAARAAAARPDFALTDANAAAVAAICRELEGVPLALELAARQVALFAPNVLLERLQDRAGDSRLHLLESAEPVLPARHRSMRESAAATVRLLAPAEQQLLAGISVFSGECTVEDAAAVTGVTEVAAHAGLESLVEWHLARRTVDRFNLDAGARAVAAAVLAERGDQEAIGRAHADLFLARLRAARDELMGVDWAAALARLDAQRDDLFAAFGAVLQNEQGTPEERTQEPGSLDELAADLLALGNAYQQAQRFDDYQMVGMMMMAVAMQRQASEPPDPKLECMEEGNQCEAAGDWEGAEAAYRRALEAADTPWGEIRPREYLAGLHAKHGRFVEALDEAQRATAAARREDLEILLGMSLTTEAGYRLRVGDAAGALAACEEAMALDLGPGDLLRANIRTTRARAHVRLSDLAAAETDLAEAWPLLEPMAAMAMAAGVRHVVSLWWTATAELRAARGDLAGAVAARREVVERLQISGEPTARLASALQSLGDALAAAGDLAAAEEHRAAGRAMRRDLHLPEEERR